MTLLYKTLHTTPKIMSYEVNYLIVYRIIKINYTKLILYLIQNL